MSAISCFLIDREKQFNVLKTKSHQPLNSRTRNIATVCFLCWLLNAARRLQKQPEFLPVSCPILKRQGLEEGNLPLDLHYINKGKRNLKQNKNCEPNQAIKKQSNRSDQEAPEGNRVLRPSLFCKSTQGSPLPSQASVSSLLYIKPCPHSSGRLYATCWVQQNSTQKLVPGEY